ncbi:MAG TPA: efflux RND transporter periplasmic adaptor subunit, partial [Parachlamydiaceae bacterium]|nr:efflux RND transporter periplasmic adaptor subunit [Parachlamydiaceae bacterium]
MFIFKSIAFYLSLLGIIAALVLIRILNAPPPPRAETRSPAINPYKEVIAASGIVESVDKNIAVGVPQSGLVTKVFVKVSDHVLQNDPLFELDTRELRAQLLEQKANVKVKEATLVRLQDQLLRLQSVKDPRAVSQEDVKTRQNDVKVAEAELNAAKALVAQTLKLIERLTVKASKAGQILQSNIRDGEYISTSQETPAILLGDIDHLQVRVDIDEQNASRFSPDLPAVAFLKNNTEYSIPL